MNKAISETSSVDSVGNFSLIDESRRIVGVVGGIFVVDLNGSSGSSWFIFECYRSNLTTGLQSLVGKRLDFMHWNIILLLLSWSSRCFFTSLLQASVSPIVFSSHIGSDLSLKSFFSQIFMISSFITMIFFPSLSLSSCLYCFLLF